MTRPTSQGRAVAHDSRSHRASGSLALVGPGRAGTTLAVALATRGWAAVAGGGRRLHARVARWAFAGGRIDAPSPRGAAERLDVPAVDTADAGRDADLVLVATPDR